MSIRTIPEIKQAIRGCKNKKNIGGSCHEFCAYRENGCCELFPTEMIRRCINEISGREIDEKQDLLIALVDELDKEPVVKPKRKAIVSGSYDPFTYGHLSIVKKAAEMFDEVHVVIFNNSKKTRYCDIDSMVVAIKLALKEAGIENCVVKRDDGLLAKYCKENDIKYTVRGLRNNMDYNYEENIAEVNHLVNPELESVYLRADYVGISSSMVKELYSYGEDVSKYVPKSVLERMPER